MSTGHDPIQLENEKNDSGVSYQMWGKKEGLYCASDAASKMVQVR